MYLIIVSTYGIFPFVEYGLNISHWARTAPSTSCMMTCFPFIQKSTARWGIDNFVHVNTELVIKVFIASMILSLELLADKKCSAFHRKLSFPLTSIPNWINNLIASIN